MEGALGEDLGVWSLLPDWHPSPPEPRQPTCTVYNRPKGTWLRCPRLPALRYQTPAFPGPAHFRGQKCLYPCARANQYSKKDAIHLWDKNAFKDDTRWQSKWRSTGSFPCPQTPGIGSQSSITSDTHAQVSVQGELMHQVQLSSSVVFNHRTSLVPHTRTRVQAHRMDVKLRQQTLGTDSGHVSFDRAPEEGS